MSTNRNRDAAREAFARYDYVRGRGHDDYCKQARRCEDFYLGGGLQWRDEDRRIMEGQQRPVHEANDILPAVNTAIGYQIANRADIQFIPKSGDTSGAGAKLLSKIVKHVLDNAHWRDHETQQFADGLIMQRGYLDMRLGFDDSVQGELVLTTIDPMDGIPDPDAKSYDPDQWADWIHTRWLTADEIAQQYGDAASREVKDMQSGAHHDAGDWEDEDGTPRARFGDANTDAPGYGTNLSHYSDGRVTRYRIIEWQRNVYERALCAHFPTGDTRVIEGMPPERVQQLLAAGVYVAMRRVRRVRMVTAAPDLVLFDDYSPYPHLTVIPYFPYFRRGRTRGMVDNGISPQEVKNKAISKAIEVINSTANSGFMIPKGSLTNMTIEQFEDRGSDTGVTIEYDPKVGKPEKIQANDMPRGLAELVAQATENMRATMGVNESLLGLGGKDMSGIAIQSRQFAAQQQLAVPLENLAVTRRMVASRALDIIQKFYVDERVFRISEPDKLGAHAQSQLVVNIPQPDGTILNDLTAGEYDVAISEVPVQVTFENSQFEQAMQLREKGIPIPDHVLLRYSALADKVEIADEMASAGQDPMREALAETEAAKAAKLRAEATNKNVEALFSSLRTAEVALSVPGTAQIADALLRSAGYKDHDEAPIVHGPAGGEPLAEPPPENTNPLTPDNPDAGIQQGIEAGV